MHDYASLDEAVGVDKKVERLESVKRQFCRRSAESDHYISDHENRGYNRTNHFYSSVPSERDFRLNNTAQQPQVLSNDLLTA